MRNVGIFRVQLSTVAVIGDAYLTSSGQPTATTRTSSAAVITDKPPESRIIRVNVLVTGVLPA
jgi:hypothetical protein